MRSPANQYNWLFPSTSGGDWNPVLCDTAEPDLLLSLPFKMNDPWHNGAFLIPNGVNIFLDIERESRYIIYDHMW
jgi:hypothetical protein